MPTSSLASNAVPWHMRHRWVQMLILRRFLNKCQVVWNTIWHQWVLWWVLPFLGIWGIDECKCRFIAHTMSRVGWTLILQRTFMQCQIVSNISQRWEIFRPFFWCFLAHTLCVGSTLILRCVRIFVRLRRLSTCTNHGSWDIYDKYSFKKRTFMQRQILSYISQRWEIFPSFFFLAFSCTYIVCGVNSYSTACTHLCTVTPTSYIYKSNDKYWCWTIYSRTTFSSLPLPFFILIIFYGQYASVYGYANFLHVQIMDREIYTINILLKNKSDVKCSLHTTAKFLLKRMKVLV